MSAHDHNKTASLTEKHDGYERRKRRRDQLEHLKTSLPEINSKFRRVIDLRKKFDARYVLLAFVAASLSLGPMWGQIAIGWAIIILCASVGFYKYRNTKAFSYEIMTLYEDDILAGRVEGRPWYKDRYVVSILIGAIAFCSNSACIFLVQTQESNLKWNAIAVGSSAANLLFTWARVEAECVETLQDKLDGKFDGKQSESIASVGPSP